MEQQRRLLAFTVVSFVILFGWMSIGPKIFPGLFPPPPKKIVEKDNKPADKRPDAEKHSDEVAEVAAKDDQKAEPKIVASVEATKLPEHPTQRIVIGSEDPETGYGLRVTLSSVGAGIIAAELNDPRYKALKGPKKGAPVPPLSLLGNNLANELKPLASVPAVTGHLSIAEIDQRLKKLDPDADLKRLNWEVVETPADAEARGVKSAVTFGLKTPDGRWELRKKFALHRWQNANALRDADPAGYQLDVQLVFKNLSSDAQTVVYDWQGPAGVPLENAEHTSKFRDIKFGFRDADGGLTTNALTSSELVNASDKQQVEELKPDNRTFQYVGIDTQYFAAFVMPRDAANKQASYLEFAKPQVIEKNVTYPARSDVSLTLHSVECAVPPETEIQHNYTLYLGPKRAALLLPLNAEKIIDYSGFLIIPASLVAGIANGLLWVLNGLHQFGIPYGICIMLLTVLVRSCMFPISKKQSNNAKKMKELQPKLAELKAKHSDDKQKFAQAQMELFSQHKFNPLGGCLPVLLQLPIFIGLYQALSSSVDLRRAPFLWFDNLAAPDHLFTLPFTLPFLGNEFNLLPILTTSLFLVQQKMFMPPPTDEQTRMQTKMFFWMTLLMGFMFYHVPAGLCVYFIASSLWSMGERKLLDYGSAKPDSASSSLISPGKKIDAPPAVKPADGFWGRLAHRLEAIGEMKDVNGIPVTGERHGKGEKSKRKKTRW